jgi:hypothetical protein
VLYIVVLVAAVILQVADGVDRIDALLVIPVFGAIVAMRRLIEGTLGVAQLAIVLAVAAIGARLIFDRAARQLELGRGVLRSRTP